MKKINYLLFIFFLLFESVSGFAASYVSIASGSWSDPAVWSLPWVGAPVPPSSGQPVTISAGTTITGSTGGAFTLDIFGTLTFNGDYSNSSGGLTIENGGTMIVTGNMTTGSALVIKGTGNLMVMGDLIQSGGSLENAGTMIVNGNMTISSSFVMNGTGKLKILGNLTQTGGSITLNNSAILDVGMSFTEGWQTTNLYNNATILVIQNYNVNGNINQNGAGTSVVVLGTVNGGGCSGCANSISPTDPAWLFWIGNVQNNWTGATNTSWTTASNWSANTVPASGATVRFSTTAANDLVLDKNRTVDSLKNLSSKRLVIPPGKCLTVNTTITTSGDPNQIYIQSSSSGANGSLIFHNAYGSPVQATVEMYSLASWNLTNPVGEKYKWQFFGIPVRSLAKASPVFDGAYVREMHENDNPLHWVQLINTSGLTSFHGYEITQQAGKTYVFQGALENSNYSVTEPYTSGVSFPGETLIGNSYTAAIDIKKIVFGTGMPATVYLYTTGSLNDWTANGQFSTQSSTSLAGQYTAVPFSLAGDNGLPGQIPSMQAFLVSALSSSGTATLSIPYSSVSTVVPNTDKQRVVSFSKNADSTQISTRIDVTGSGFSDRMWIFTNAACSHRFDNGYDGEKIIGSIVVPQIYAMEDDGIYQVNSVDDMNNSYLGFQAGIDSLYTLTFTHQNMNLKYSRIFLLDSVAQKTTDITASGSIYTFTALSTDAVIKRFKIVAETNLSTFNPGDSSLVVFSSQRTIFIDNKSNADGTLQVVDIAGRIVKKFPFTASGVTTVRTTLPQGSYVAMAITKKDRLTTRLILH